MRCDTYTLEDLASIKYGKNQKKILSKNGSIPIYGTGGIMGYGKEALYNKPSVLIGRKGSIEKIRYVDHPFWTVDTLFYTEINTNLVIPHFLYYKIMLLDLKKYNEGTTVPSLRTETLNKLKFDIPKLEQQKKILSVLEPIDKKIESLNKINDNLEQQAQDIFKAWFVDFEPFGGVMPDDWKIVSLSEVADFIGGYSYKGTELGKSDIAMATIKNFRRGGGFKLDGYKEIIPSDKFKSVQYADLFDILVAHTDLTQNAEVIGNAEIILNKSKYDNIIFSMDLVKVVPKEDKISKFIIASILKNENFKHHCLGYINGTTVLHLSKRALNDYKFALPNDLSIVKPLENILSLLYENLALNTEQTMYLTSLRDTLLPKLMSGEIDASNIEI